MNFPAVSASVSASSRRWHSSRSWSSATSRCRHWMCRFRRRSSTCSRICRRSTGRRTFSSRTICRSWSTSRMRWASCTWAAWWNTAPRRICSPSRCTPIRVPCSRQFPFRIRMSSSTASIWAAISRRPPIRLPDASSIPVAPNAAISASRFRPSCGTWAADTVWRAICTMA